MFHVARKILLIAIIAGVQATASAGVPTADFSVSGGNGTSLSITFNDTFQLTLERDSIYTRLVFHGIYAAPSSSEIAPLTRLNYTLGGIADTQPATTPALYDWNAPATASLAASDFMMPVTDGMVGSGAVYRFLSGQTLTTTGNWASNPADYASSFQIYLVDVLGNRSSDIINGTIGAGAPPEVAIPEPATSALVAGLAAVSCCVGLRRRKGARAV